jgi:hypothetical protein
MKVKVDSLFFIVLLMASIACEAQTEPAPVSATPAILKAFQSHDIVMLGETHGNKQEYQWLRALVSSPEFADSVDDIVMEFGNSLYQQAVDRYVSGENVPVEEIQGAWRDTVASVGPPSPVYESLYQAVREVNLKRKSKHQIRILCGDPNIDWKQVKEANDILPYLKTRDRSYARVVETEVIAKHRRALLIMGTFHFLRGFDLMPARKQFDIEQQIRDAGANPYLIVFGTNTVGRAGELDHRFDSWRIPSIVPLADNWVGDLPAIPVVTEGHGPALPSLKLKDAADALLYLGPPTSLETVQMSPSELVGTSYGKEIERREKLQMALEK